MFMPPLQPIRRRCSVSSVVSIPKASELSSLSVEDRLRLLDEIWESLSASPEQIPLPEWHLEEIRRRVAAFEADGNPGRPAEEVFADLKRRL